MTLVVARIRHGRISIASDTLLTEHDRPLPFQEGTIKSCMLPGGICVSFSNSPKLAADDFKNFSDTFPHGTGFSNVISFFKESSTNSNNDYLIAFSKSPKLVKIADGRRIIGSRTTQWIGDKDAFEIFREYETDRFKRMERGRAVNAVMFGLEPDKSPASELYSTMRHVVADRKIDTVGGFVCVISNQDQGFIHSVYSDMLYNWPESESDDYLIDYNDQIDLGASGENSDYAACQISTGCSGMNCVAFYLLKGKMLILYYGEKNGLPNKCHVYNDVAPGHIEKLLTEFGALNWRIYVTSASGNNNRTIRRSPLRTADPKGIGVGSQIHADTLAKTSNLWKLEAWPIQK